MIGLDIRSRTEITIEQTRLLLHQLEDALASGSPEDYRKADQRAAVIAERAQLLASDVGADVCRAALGMQAAEA